MIKQVGLAHCTFPSALYLVKSRVEWCETSAMHAKQTAFLNFRKIAWPDPMSVEIYRN